MRTGGGKVAASRRMHSSTSVIHKSSNANGEDPRLKAGWDEEFFGHELPPDYKISGVRPGASDAPDAKDMDGRCDVLERALWDEFLGHHLPPNYVISRLETPEGEEKKGRGGGRRGARGQRHRHHHHQEVGSRSNRHVGSKDTDDTLEYSIDKTVDSYVLSKNEIPRAGCKDASRGSNRRSDDTPGAVVSRSKRDDSSVVHKGETFEERALRFGVEDWNLVGNKKWPQNESKGVSKRSTRRGIFHSPSGSDTSSMISTLESSSFSCGSEGSSFAKTDFSSSSFNLSHVHAMSGGAIPFSLLGRHPSGICAEHAAIATKEEEEDVEDEEEQFVELNILTRERVEDGCVAGGNDVNAKDGSSYFEFNFLDGKMVESDEVEERDSSVGEAEKVDSSPSSEDLSTSRGADGRGSASEFLNAPAQSPESENFFDSSHDSDWSGAPSASTVDHHDGLVACATETEAGDFEDNGSNFTEDLCSDAQFFDADPGVTPPNSSNSAIKDRTQSSVDATEAVTASEASKNFQSNVDSSTRSVAKAASEDGKSIGRSPKKVHGSTPRKARSLGSVLSHHLAFTAVPSLRYKSQPSFTGPEQKQNSSKVSAACIEWLWSEKEAMKPVRALQALAERENAEKERIGSSPPVRNLDSAFKESSRPHTAGKPQALSNIKTSSPAVSSHKISDTKQKDLTKESRESISAYRAPVYGVGDSGGSTSSRARRSSAPACKVSVTATPSLRHCHRGSLSPRKRSVNFVPQAGARPGGGSSFGAKQRVPSKSLAVELEVLCRPFGPVLKGVRFLPTAKRGLGRPPLFSNLGHHLASTSSSASSTGGSLPAALRCGKLQCVVSRDGLPSYSLIMDETEEIFAAKTLRLEAAGMYEGVSHVYTFHSFKGKGKGRSGWRQWGKREKPGSDFVGNMTVTSTVYPVVESTGVQNYVESEFVLFDAKVKEVVSLSCPASRTNPHSRSSFSTWDMLTTPQTSPQGGLTSSAYSSPSSTVSLPSPTGAFSTPGAIGSAGATTPTKSVPSRTVSLTLPVPGGAPTGCSTILDKGVTRHKSLEKHSTFTSTFTSPLHESGVTGPNGGTVHERAVDSDTADECDSRRWTTGSVGGGLSQTQCELAAVVVRTPLEKAQGKAATGLDKWGWGINFLRKTCDSARPGCSPDDTRTPGSSPSGRFPTATALTTPSPSPATSPPAAVRESTMNSSAMNQRCGSCGSSSTDEEPPSSHGGGGLNITLVLPSGEHGCSANGIDGPQPLIERWRSGGKCDCGSWDLGCGLTIVANCKGDNVENLLGSRNQSRENSTLRLYVEGKKHQTVGLALTPLKEGCYTLGFHAPIAPLHAFATAVAVLHSKDPILAAKRAGETKKRLTRIPVKVVPASSRSFSRSTDEQQSSGSRPLVSYKLVCPDPPASPFGRA